VDFAFSARAEELRDRLGSFMDTHVLPAEPVYDRQLAEAADPHALPPVMVELKEKARAEGLWNLFLAHGGWGAGLTNLEYAPLAELMGHSIIGNEVFNCAAPDTGNMELLALFGTTEQQERWLKPLLDARIRSCFAMTEPDVASSDARNIRTRVTRDGDHYVVDGRKWYTSGILDPDCELIILMGVSDPSAPAYRQQSMVLIPRHAPGVTVVRDHLNSALVQDGDDDDVTRRWCAEPADGGSVADLVRERLSFAGVAAHELDGVAVLRRPGADGGGHVARADDADGGHDDFLCFWGVLPVCGLRRERWPRSSRAEC